MLSKKIHNQYLLYEQAVNRCYIEITSTTGEGFKEIHLKFEIRGMFIQNDFLEKPSSDGRCPGCVGLQDLVQCHVSKLYLRYAVSKIPGSQKLPSEIKLP